MAVAIAGVEPEQRTAPERSAQHKWRTHAVAMIGALVVAFSFGLNYALANGNHHTYVLDGLRRLDPAFLARDWLATETYAYHPVFAWVVVAAGRAGSVAWGLALANVVVIAVSMLVLYALLRSIARPVAIGAWLLLAGAVLLDRTASVGGSYIFNPEFQPSGLASLALLYAIASYIRGNALRAGFGLAFAGVMHVNFLLVGLAAFGISQCVLVVRALGSGFGRDALLHWLRDSVAVLAPALAVFAVDLPMLLEMARAEQGELGRRIFLFVRSPHHYVPAEWLYQFGPFAAWQLLALAGYRWVRTVPGIRARLLALHGALVGVIAVSTLLTTAVFIPTVSQLYFWRLAPFAVLLAQLVLAIGLVQRVAVGAAAASGERWTMRATAERWRQAATRRVAPTIEQNRWRLLAWASAAVGWIVLMRYHMWREGITGAATLSLLGVTVAFLATAVYANARRATAQANSDEEVPTLWKRSPGMTRASLRTATAIALAFFLVLSGSRLSRGIMESNVLYPDSPPDERALFAWAQTTERAARFLIPPSLAPFRLRAGRAVVVDWKSTPILADELVEWYRRVARVSGLTRVTDLEAATHGYHAMNDVRLGMLVHEFDVDYAVVGSTSPLANLSQDVVYQNETFTVLDVRPPKQ